jgi:hypothetical protein
VALVAAHLGRNTSEFSRDTVGFRLGQVACVLEGAGQSLIRKTISNFYLFLEEPL